MRHLHALGHTDIEFVVCGDGPKKQLYERLARDCPTIRLFGWVDQPRLTALARRCSIGAVAYGSGAPQSIPNKPIEYMASKLAVLSTLAGGELEVLLRDTRSGVTLVEPSPAQISRQLLRWKDKPELLSALRNSAFATYGRHFDARMVYSDMADHLETIVGAGKSSACLLRQAP
jgi:glycosyltransferase involved in cell wall biosynthesis